MREEVPPTAEPATDETWELRLYVAGHTTRSMSAPANRHRYCQQHVPGRYQPEGIDLLRHPQRTGGDQVLTISSVVRQVLGDLSNEERMLVGLDLRPQLR